MYRPMKSDKRFFLSLIRGSECAVNPLFYAKRHVTDFYAQPSTRSEPVITLQFQDLTLYGENPLYDNTAASSNERYVDNIK